MCPSDELPKLAGPLDSPFAFTTSSGCDIIFDEKICELLILGSEGSEASLTLTDLRELAQELRSPAGAAFLALLVWNPDR